MYAYRGPFVGSVMLHCLLVFAIGAGDEPPLFGKQDHPLQASGISLTLSHRQPTVSVGVLQKNLPKKASAVLPTKPEVSQSFSGKALREVFPKVQQVKSSKEAGEELGKQQNPSDSNDEILKEASKDHPITDEQLYGKRQMSEPKNESVRKKTQVPALSLNDEPGPRQDSGPGNSPVGILSLPEPSYPRSCRRQGYEGRVVVEITVLPSGKVQDMYVLESSGFKGLDRAALRAAEHGRYAPSRILGIFVKAKKKLAFTFRLTAQTGPVL